MNATRTAQLALVLSAITLVVVLFIAVRPLPEPAPPVQPVEPVGTAALGAALRAELQDLRVDITTLQQSIVDTQSLVRAVLDRGGSQGGGVPGNSSDLSRQLDRLEASLATATAKLDAICGAIESSAFAPSGFNCP